MSTATPETTEEVKEMVEETQGAVATAASTPLTNLVTKVHTAKAEDKTKLVERDVEIDLFWLSILARQHGIFVGGGGVAKSMTIDSGMEHIDLPVDPFKIMLRKSMPVEEIFGQLSINGLKNDVFRYITAGGLAEAFVGFCDEIFKGNAVVLNAMLMAINERLFRNEGSLHKIPLWSLFGASNELPTEPELAAFRDRFSWTKEVTPVQTDDGFKTVLRGALDRTRNVSQQITKITQPEIEALQHAVTQVTVGEDVLNDIATMKRRAEGEFQLFISARRYIAGLELCRANAVLNNRANVISDDLTLFQHTLWTDMEDSAKAYEITLDYAGKVARVTQQLRDAFDPYHTDLAALKSEIPSDGAISQEIAGKVATIQMNLKQVATQIEKQIEDAKSDGRDVSELEALRNEVNSDRDFIREDILG